MIEYEVPEVRTIEELASSKGIIKYPRVTSEARAGFILDPNLFCHKVSDVECQRLTRGIAMPTLLLQSPLTNFANLIATYLAEIWDFLIFIGQICAFIVVLVGAILWFTDTNAGKGKGPVLSGILPGIVVEFLCVCCFRQVLL